MVWHVIKILPVFKNENPGKLLLYRLYRTFVQDKHR